MSQNGGDAPKASSPAGRPRHQIKRSISEISGPIRLHRHQSHRLVRDTERDTRSPAPQSAAAQGAQSERSFEWSRSAGVTPNLTPSASRRTSILYASADEVIPPPTKTSEDSAAVVTNGLAMEQQQQKAAAAARESGLHRSFADLETFATTTTKQLDDTCYSVLEKLGTLQATIVALKELAEHSRDLSSTFDADSRELVGEISAQLDAFDRFEDQARRITSLQSRINTGRELVRSLSARVDAVSERVEGWGRADREWQEKTRRRLKVVWVVTLGVAVLVLSLFIGAQYVSEGLEETTARAGLETLRGGEGTEVRVVEGVEGQGGGVVMVNETEAPGVSSALPDMLRVFDEL
ncbi:hypothetical protein C8A05DRAFT_16820 [Staphylotrichum tortipilum]|uniref:Uncharacterized protein n=1 Tax=Staphylotrichum tortipilum TaxID=2831512 RepID=A0AAN6MIN2_9PEZI|nr:hypothetical protein C8A05DRAFT_16820 [Staphylotrichum longicolle]